MDKPILSVVVVLVLVASGAHGAEVYVNPTTGDDSADGLSPMVQGRSGPHRTISRAVRLAGPGDTVHLAKAVYHESVNLTGKSGERGKPLVIDGHGAVIEGARDVDPATWQEVAPGLYRNTALFGQPLRRLEEWVWRWFFLFDGKMNRMGRCMKGTNVPYKSPPDLEPGEWTYQQDDGHAFYLQIDPAKKLSECRVATPWLVNGVSVHGGNHDLVIRNLTATHVLNDGYNISPATEKKIHDVVFENICSIECGDDGLSAHGNSTVRVENFYSTGNGTGLCTTGNSVNDRLFIKDNVGFEVYFYPYPCSGRTKHVITNSRIDCRAANALLVQGGKNPEDLCLLKLDNVVIQRSPGSPVGLAALRTDERVRLEARYLTAVGLALQLGGRGASLTESVIAGSPEGSIAVESKAGWEASRNIYDIARLRHGEVFYTPAEFDLYRQATGQDWTSKWGSVDVVRLLGGKSRLEIEGTPIGADLRLVPGWCAGPRSFGPHDRWAICR